MADRARLPPSLSLAPPPWSGVVVPLPHEVELGPSPVGECRRCGGTRHRLERELRRARSVFFSLLQLLEHERDERRLIGRKRERAERERAEFQALLAQFGELAGQSDAALASGQELVCGARVRVGKARRAVTKERDRGRELQQENKRLKAVSSRAVRAMAAKLQAAEVALEGERQRALRHERYGQALEARLRELGEQELAAVAVEQATTDDPAARHAFAAAARPAPQSS